jgi:predicted enzyme related to lactoylglutathione lyase
MNVKSWLISLCIIGLLCMTSVVSFAQGTDVFKQHGAVSWYELMTTDVDAATKFYTQLLGWETEDSPMPDGSKYVLIKVNGRPVGGMMKTPPQAQGVPPYWGLYVTVNDVDATAKQAQQLGGKILLPPTDLPENARFCVMQDPQGAVIEIITYQQKEK